MHGGARFHDPVLVDDDVVDALERLTPLAPLHQTPALQALASARAALPNVPMHEYQHSVFDRNLAFVNTTMRCERGAFTLPQGPGLGIEPTDALWKHVRKPR